MKDLVIEKMYEWSKKPYQKFFKKNLPWTIGKKELLSLPQESLGFHLGCFLIKYHFEIQPKLEDHDVIHVLTKTGISVQEEIGMQYYLLGNGKKSLYLFLVIVSGTCFYPTQFTYFINEYKRGKKALCFHYLDYSKMLLIPVEQMRETFKIN
jgi:ubiquinone biosynthesis protein Coq4